MVAKARGYAVFPFCSVVDGRLRLPSTATVWQPPLVRRERRRARPLRAIGFFAIEDAPNDDAAILAPVEHPPIPYA